MYKSTVDLCWYFPVSGFKKWDKQVRAFVDVMWVDCSECTMLPLEEDVHMYYVAAVAESNVRELHLRTVLGIKCIHMQYQKVWLALPSKLSNRTGCIYIFCWSVIFFQPQLSSLHIIPLTLHIFLLSLQLEELGSAMYPLTLCMHNIYHKWKGYLFGCIYWTVQWQLLLTKAVNLFIPLIPRDGQIQNHRRKCPFKQTLKKKLSFCDFYLVSLC